tara:strand:+ start:637 stop:1032 length:396 start_codon:yes stop_codon:yes gene_type:complete
MKSKQLDLSPKRKPPANKRRERNHVVHLRDPDLKRVNLTPVWNPFDPLPEANKKGRLRTLMGKIIDVRQWMPAIKRLAQQQLPLIELREQLAKEKADVCRLLRDLESCTLPTAADTAIKNYLDRNKKRLDK